VTGRSPARLLAPLALVVCAVALYAVVSSGGGDSSDGAADSARPDATATATAKPTKKSAKDKPSGKTYTVRPGDTPSSIAERAGVELSALLDANPNADPNALSPGQKLKLP
jgi:LysM repeat protein